MAKVKELVKDINDALQSPESERLLEVLGALDRHFVFGTRIRAEAAFREADKLVNEDKQDVAAARAVLRDMSTPLSLSELKDELGLRGRPKLMTDRKPLYRTDIVIWSEFDPAETELETLAREATSGKAYCSRYHGQQVEAPEEDPAWDGTDFFE